MTLGNLHCAPGHALSTEGFAIFTSVVLFWGSTLCPEQLFSWWNEIVGDGFFLKIAIIPDSGVGDKCASIASEEFEFGITSPHDQLWVRAGKVVI